MDEIRILRQKLHNTPEPSMKETDTKNILMQFLKENTNNLELTDRGCWFYALKEGTDTDKAIAFRADFDAVVCADGCARHLCGHDGHSAALAGFALWLDRTEIKDDVYLIFQPGEETGEGAVLCSPLLKEKPIEEIYGFHNIPGFEENSLVVLDHTFACASTGLEITLAGKESHAANPENGINPALAVSQLVQSMHEYLRQEHRGIVLGTVIGIDLGSESYGVSAGEGILRLTLRAEYQEEYDQLVGTVERLAIHLAEENGLECRIRRMEEFPATENDISCVKKLRTVAAELGLTIITPNEPFRWSEDFGHYLHLTKGAFFGVGAGINHLGLHTMGYEFPDEILGTVIDIYKRIVLN